MDNIYNAEGNAFRLKNCNIFDNLGNPKVFETNSIIYQQGDEAEYVYYLKKGKIQIYIGSPNGMERVLSVFTGGNLFGKSSFFDNMPRASGAKALKKSEIICIDKPMMMKLIGEHPQFAIDMLEYLSKTIRMFSNQIESMSFLQADKRIARFIINNISNNDDKLICTHDEISEIIGASRVTVSKILSKFVKNGCIETKYRRIRVLDAEALTNFAFDK